MTQKERQRRKTLGADIQTLRHALDENTATFGERFACSSRTIECWEQGARTPGGLALKLLTRLATAYNRRQGREPQDGFKSFWPASI